MSISPHLSFLQANDLQTAVWVQNKAHSRMDGANFVINVSTALQFGHHRLYKSSMTTPCNPVVVTVNINKVIENRLMVYFIVHDISSANICSYNENDKASHLYIDTAYKTHDRQTNQVANRELQNEKFMSTEPGTFRFRSKRAKS